MLAVDHDLPAFEQGPATVAATEPASDTWRWSGVVHKCERRVTISAMKTLKELEEQRSHACRLMADRALATLDDAEAFLLDRGMLTRSADSALPSLFDACHEDPYAPGSRGFGQWPATKWPWFGALAERGYLVLKIHRGKSLIITEATAGVLDPICRAELVRMENADEGWAKLLRHLLDAGPSSLDDLQTELSLKPRELKAIRSPLERCGAIVSRSVVYPAGRGHVHSSELARWDQVHFGPSDVDVHLHHSLGNLLVAAVRAAIVTPEQQLKRWFSWGWYWDDAIVDDLVTDGRLRRVDGHVTATETTSSPAPAEPAR